MEEHSTFYGRELCIKLYQLLLFHVYLFLFLFLFQMASKECSNLRTGKSMRETYVRCYLRWQHLFTMLHTTCTNTHIHSPSALPLAALLFKKMPTFKGLHEAQDKLAGSLLIPKSLELALFSSNKLMLFFNKK